MGSWKLWSYAGSFDATSLYGVGGQPPERRLMHWRGISGTTEYPPLALYEMSLVGRIYRAMDPVFNDSTLLTCLIKLPGLLFEAAFVIAMLTWGRRKLGGAARWIALGFWLNPAIVINGAALGYLDAEMAVPAALALVAAAVGSPGLAGGLLAAAVLTKAQAVFIAPVVVLAVLTTAGRPLARALGRFFLGGAVVTCAAILPIVAAGAGRNMLQALNRLAAHDMLSGNALNVWWIVTWIVRAWFALDLGWWKAFSMPVKILGISRFIEIGFPNPKPIATLVAGLLILWGLWRIRRVRFPATWAYAGGWCVLAYAMLNTQVHENHAYLAVPFLAVAAGLDTAYRRIFWGVSGLVAFNMYIFYGLGNEWPVVFDRRWTGLDATVIAAFGALAIFGWATRRLVSRTD